MCVQIEQIVTKGNISYRVKENLITASMEISYYSPKYEGAYIVLAFCYQRIFPYSDNVNDNERHFEH